MTHRLARRSGDETHGAILDLIRSAGVVSRVELAERSGLTGTSISKIVKRLIDDGLVIETGYGASTGGKRPVLLGLNTQARYAVGIALGSAEVTYVVTDLSGEVLAERSGEGIRRTEPRLVAARAADELTALLASAQVDREDVLGVGIAVSGRLDQQRRSSSRSPEWEEFDLEGTLHQATGLRVTLEKDYVCAALGEYWTRGLGPNRDFATVYMAGGIGCAIMLGGRPYRGTSSNVGEIGHVVLEADGPPCACGNRGCLEILAAPVAVVADALRDSDFSSRIGLSGEKARIQEDFRRISVRATEGDPEAAALIESSARYLAKALVSLTNLLDLDTIFLAGPGFSGAGPTYRRVVAEEIEQHAFVRAVHGTTVTLAAHGLAAPALGAAVVVLQGVISTR